jgi:type IV secretion system protein VirD4
MWGKLVKHPQIAQHQVVPAAKLQINPSFYVLGGLAVAFVIVSLLMGQTGKKGKTARARWASLDELKNAKTIGLSCKGKKAKFDRATYYIVEPIGTPPKEWAKSDRNALYLPDINQGMLVVGGAGWGKSANAIEPAAISALLQGHTVALFDYKFDNNGLAETLLPVAIDCGYQARIFAPGSILSGVYNVCDGISSSNDLAGAREVVGCIERNTSDQNAKTNAFFDGGGRSLLEGAFLMARWIAEQSRNPAYANILTISQVLSMPDLSQRLLEHRAQIPPWIYSAFSILTASGGGNGKNDTEGGLLATAIQILSPMIVPNFLGSLCGTSTFPGMFADEPLKADGKQLLIFGVNQANEKSTLPLVATALEQIISYNLKYQRDKPLVIILDEFDTLNLPVALDWLNRYRSSGCSLIIGIQYLGQMESRYGKARSQGFLASCATKIWFNPGDPDTAKVISEMLCRQEIELPNISKSTNSGKGGGGSSRSESKQLHQVALVEAHEPMNFPKGTCIIQCPAVGSKTEAGLPFRHSFRYSKAQSDKYKADCAAKYQLLCDVARTSKQDKPDIDYTELMAQAFQQIDDLLPLKPKLTV